MEEEKRKGAEKKKEEKRQEREVRRVSRLMDGDTLQNIKMMSPWCVCVQREEEKQRRLKRQQDLLKLASQHYNRKLLLQRGLLPWKRFIQLKIQNTQVNKLISPVILPKRP